MFKKIEIWILYLVVLLSFPFAVGFGFLVRQELAGSQKLGMISQSALFLTEIPSKLKYLLEESGLELKVNDRFPNLSGFNGLPNDEEQYLLLSTYDGNSKEGKVELVDLTNFDVLHTWNPDIDQFNKNLKNNDEFKYMNRDRNNSRFLLTHPQIIIGSFLNQ